MGYEVVKPERLVVDHVVKPLGMNLAGRTLVRASFGLIIGRNLPYGAVEIRGHSSGELGRREIASTVLPLAKLVRVSVLNLRVPAIASRLSYSVG